MTCEGASPDAPRILSFASSTPTTTIGGRITFTAIVTDPDGIDDVIGGMLVDGGTGTTYGAFATSAAEGAYSMELDAREIVGPLDSGLAPLPRIFRARFFDVARHTAEAEVTVSIECGGGQLLCGGTCVPSNVEHCGACDDRCAPPEGGEGPAGECVEHACTSRPGLAIESFTATVTTPTPPEGWGEILTIGYALRGRGLPSTVHTLSLSSTDGGGFSFDASSFGHFTTESDGSFVVEGELSVSASSVTAASFRPGTFGMTATGRDASGRAAGATTTASFSVPSCPGTSEHLACGGPCESYYRDEACGSCGLVCGASRTVTHFPRRSIARTETVATTCVGALGCAFYVYADNSSCAQNCADNGGSCGFVLDDDGGDAPESCASGLSGTRRCVCLP